MRHLLSKLAQAVKRVVGLRTQVSGTAPPTVEPEPWELPGYHWKRREWERDEIVKRFDVLDDEEAARRFFEMHRRNFLDYGSVLEAALGGGEPTLLRVNHLSEGARRRVYEMALDHITAHLHGSRSR